MRNRILSGVVLVWTTILVAATPNPLNIKPGLWQVTMTSKISALPAPHTRTYQSCIRKEDLSQYPFTDPDAHCTWKVVSSTGSQMEANGTCTPEGMGQVEFKMRLEAVDPQNVKGTGELTANGPAGALSGSYAGTAQWIGARCPAE